MQIDSVSESTLITLRSLPDEIAAVALDGRMRVLEEVWKHGFVERGLILLEMEQRMLWKALINPNTQEPYNSFERWIITAAPQSRSDAYAALKVVKELRDIPRQHLGEMTRCNVDLLCKVSSSVRMQPDVIEAAKELPLKALIQKINKDYPGQHLTEPGTGVIEEAVRLAMRIEGLDSKDDVIRFWAIQNLAENIEAETGPQWETIQ